MLAVHSVGEHEGAEIELGIRRNLSRLGYDLNLCFFNWSGIGTTKLVGMGVDIEVAHEMVRAFQTCERRACGLSSVCLSRLSCADRSV